jgi:hypothetical protein
VSGKPHRWLNEIVAWARGEVVLYRVCYDDGTWSMWFTVPKEHRFMDYPNYEYRLATVPEPHKWQREKEAFLAGKEVEFCNTGYETEMWNRLKLLESKVTLGSDSKLIPIWDAPWLKFRIAPDEQMFAARLFKDVLGNLCFTRGGKANVKLSFNGDELKGVELL